ncbi:hypothetical protein ABFS82_10G020100 [Erythranthe guttata]
MAGQAGAGPPQVQPAVAAAAPPRSPTLDLLREFIQARREHRLARRNRPRSTPRSEMETAWLRRYIMIGIEIESFLELRVRTRQDVDGAIELRRRFGFNGMLKVSPDQLDSDFHNEIVYM